MYSNELRERLAEYRELKAQLARTQAALEETEQAIKAHMGEREELLFEGAHTLGLLRQQPVRYHRVPAGSRRPVSAVLQNHPQPPVHGYIKRRGEAPPFLLTKLLSAIHSAAGIARRDKGSRKKIKEAARTGKVTAPLPQHSCRKDIRHRIVCTMPSILARYKYFRLPFSVFPALSSQNQSIKMAL